MKDTELYERAIQWAKKNGFSNLKANIETDDYDVPAGFTRTGEDAAYIPDLSGTKRGGKNYIEIALKTEAGDRQVSKYKLLSTMAGMKSGKLYLLAPKGHKAFVDKMVKQYNINADVISI